MIQDCNFSRMSDSKEVLVDPELREMVVRALENAGTLQNIRAQLRAATYLTLEGQQDFPVSTARIRSISQTENGILAIQLIRDFLLFADLPHSLAVFDAESGSKSISAQEADRISAGYTLDLPVNSDKPLLLQLVENSQSSAKELQRPKTAGRKIQSPLPSSSDDKSAGDNDVLET